MICRSKWFIPKYHLAPGHEIIAEVNQVGSEVKDFKKGDLVGQEPFEKFAENANTANKDQKNYVEMLIILLMIPTGVDMLLLCNKEGKFKFRY